jgi:hypothetical protein
MNAQLKNTFIFFSDNFLVRTIFDNFFSVLGERCLFKWKKMMAEHQFFKSNNFSKVVLDGPFKGMRYPSLHSKCSVMAPKIIGSYESELLEVVNSVPSKGYDIIIDIGCAEGYYAVGFALTSEKSSIYAYDIDNEALNLCSEMAQLNGVSNKIKLANKFSPNDLLKIDKNKKTFILCDCEGFEKQLFTKETVPYLINTDLLIEMHDIFDDTISATVLPLFSTSHELKILKSHNPNPSLYSILNSYNDEEKELILSEKRDGPMTWAYLKSTTWAS